jgi:hypothetical protein
VEISQEVLERFYKPVMNSRRFNWSELQLIPPARAARRHGQGRVRRLDMTEHILRSTSVSRPLATRLTRLLRERKCFVSSGEGVSYTCIFFSRI